MTGYTAIPPHKKLIKVSLGAENSVDWEYVKEYNDVIKRLRSEGYLLVAIEQTPYSVDYREVDYTDKVAVFFGHEVKGLFQEVID